MSAGKIWITNRRIINFKPFFSFLEADIIVEVVEVFINSILYARNIYPTSIFRKKKCYNSSVFTSIYPPLNEYVKNILMTARELIKTSKLYRIELLIYKKELNLESFIFEINNNQETDGSIRDKYLIGFEEDIRKSLLNLDERIKTLDPIPKDVQFKIFMHTTESSFVKLTNNTELFPWIQDKQTSKMFKKTKMSSILPITCIKSLGFQVYAERNN